MDRVFGSERPSVGPSGGVGAQSNVLELQSIGELDVAEEAFMRAIPLVAITFAALSLSTIGAHAAPWCADYSGKGGSNCGFHSFEQCQAAVSGRGGFCRTNPFE